MVVKAIINAIGKGKAKPPKFPEGTKFTKDQSQTLLQDAQIKIEKINAGEIKAIDPTTLVKPMDTATLLGVKADRVSPVLTPDNIKTRKGKVVAGSTKVQNNTYMGTQITTVSDSTFYIDDCIFTSCDPSKFYIGSKQAKIIYGDKIILKPLSSDVGGVPIFAIP